MPEMFMETNHTRRERMTKWTNDYINPLIAISRGSGYKFFVTMYHESAIRIEHYM